MYIPIACPFSCKFTTSSGSYSTWVKNTVFLVGDIDWNRYGDRSRIAYSNTILNAPPYTYGWFIFHYIYIHIIVGYIRRCLLVLFLSPTISMIHWINPLRPQLLLQQMDWFSWENLQEALFLFFNPIFTGVPSDFPPTMKSMEKSCILGAEIS